MAAVTEEERLIEAAEAAAAVSEAAHNRACEALAAHRAKISTSPNAVMITAEG